MTICKRCGRILKNPASIINGMGKVCAQKSSIALTSQNKKEHLKQHNMFGSRAKYDSERIGDIIVITDLGGLKSVTNDAERVIEDLYMEHSDLEKCQIIYRDSEGIWDRIIIAAIQPIILDFMPIMQGKIIRSREEAIEAIQSKIINQEPSRVKATG